MPGPRDQEEKRDALHPHHTSPAPKVLDACTTTALRILYARGGHACDGEAFFPHRRGGRGTSPPQGQPGGESETMISFDSRQLLVTSCIAGEVSWKRSD
jgi:hypothetical protein